MARSPRSSRKPATRKGSRGQTAADAINDAPTFDAGIPFDPSSLTASSLAAEANAAATALAPVASPHARSRQADGKRRYKVPHIEIDEQGVPRSYQGALSAQARAIFLLSLQRWPCVATACRVSRIPSAVAYRARRTDPQFAALWDESYEAGKCELEAISLHRAFIGVRTSPIVHRGKVVGWNRNSSDRLAELHLRRARPEEYSERLMVHGGIAHRHVHEHTVSPEIESLLRQAVDARAGIVASGAIIEGKADRIGLDAAQPSAVIDRALLEVRRSIKKEGNQAE